MSTCGIGSCATADEPQRATVPASAPATIRRCKLIEGPFSRCARLARVRRLLRLSACRPEALSTPSPSRRRRARCDPARCRSRRDRGVRTGTSATYKTSTPLAGGCASAATARFSRSGAARSSSTASSIGVTPTDAVAPSRNDFAVAGPPEVDPLPLNARTTRRCGRRFDSRHRVLWDPCVHRVHRRDRLPGERPQGLGDPIRHRIPGERVALKVVARVSFKR